MTEDRRIQSATELNVYQSAYRLAMDIFELTKGFPPDEKYALTSQTRRSSRSVCLNLREARAKRRYEARFLSEMTDCDGEINETEASLDFARDCGYIAAEEHSRLADECRGIGRMLGAMVAKSGSFGSSDEFRSAYSEP